MTEALFFLGMALLVLAGALATVNGNRPDSSDDDNMPMFYGGFPW